MKRTAYFNNTKPSQDQLNWTETSKTNAILERFRSLNQFGIQTGFRVTINGLNAAKIDVGVGEGYTGGFYPTSNLRGVDSGERIATNDGSYTATATAVALADYTVGVPNYVSLVFSETASDALPERSYPFTSHVTRYEETFTVSVLSETNWNLLTTVQKQSRILVAIVTPHAATLVTTDIEQVFQPKTHPICSNPINITGVTVVGISSTTLTGTATLTFTAPNSFRFTAPNDTIGPAVTVTSSGEWTVYSSTAQYYIILDVVYTNLPAIAATDSLTVSSLYGREIPLASAADTVHRDMVGSGLVTTGNPHGLALTDISGGSLSHADLFHLNGIGYEAAPTQLSGSTAAGDIIQIVNLGGYANTFLIDGNEYELIYGKAAGDSGEVQFSVADGSGDYLIYLDSAARPQKVRIASYVGGGVSVLWNSFIMIWDMHNTIAGSASIKWTTGSKTLQYQSPGDALGTAVHVNTLTPGGTDYSGFYKLYSNNGIDWVIVYANGNVDSLGTQTSVFTSDKSEAANSDESILKVCIITWDAAVPEGFVIISLRDIRKFITADDREQLLEEHDTSGRHTKELRNKLRVGVANNAFQAIAATSSAAFVQARTGSVALLASAPTSAMVASASKNSIGYIYGAIGDAANHENDAAAIPVGVYGIATNTATAKGVGIWGSAGDIGVYGFGSNIGVSGSGGTAGCFEAIGAAGVGIYATGSTYGIYASGINTAGCFEAIGAGGVGIYATGSLYGINASVGVGTAGKFEALGAGGIAIDATGSTCGIHVSAINTAGKFEALGAGGVGIWGSAGDIGVYGFGSNIGVSGSGGTYGVVGACGTAFMASPTPGTFANFYGMHISAVGAAISKTAYAAITANLGYPTAAVIKSVYGFINDATISWASRHIGFDNTMTNSSNASICIGVRNDIVVDTADSYVFGYKANVNASTVTTYQAGISQYIVNSLTTPDMAGIDQTVTAYNVANAVYGFYNSVGGDPSGKIATAYAQYNSVSVKDCNVARGWYGKQSAVTATVALVGVENTVHYDTAIGNVYAGVLKASGSSALNAYGLMVENTVSTSLGNYAAGIQNYVSYAGMVVTPLSIFGINNEQWVSNAVDARGLRNVMTVGTANTMRGIQNHVQVAKVGDLYGISNKVFNGDADAANLIYGIFNSVRGGNAGQVTAIAADNTMDGYVNGTVYGVAGIATNRFNNALARAIGVYGSAVGVGLGANSCFGVYGTADGGGTAGCFRNAGVNGVGIYATGSSYGIRASCINTAGYFEAIGAGGVGIYATGSTYGITASGINTAGCFEAIGAGGVGIYATGSTYGINASVGVGTAGKFEALGAGGVGIYATGSTYGIYASGIKTAGRFEAIGAGGVGIFSTGSICGISASGTVYGGKFAAASPTGTAIYASGVVNGIHALGGGVAGYGVQAFGGVGGVSASGGSYGVMADGDTYGLKCSGDIADISCKHGQSPAFYFGEVTVAVAIKGIYYIRVSLPAIPGTHYFPVYDKWP